MELRRKSKEKKKNELTGQQSSFQNWEVTTKVEKHNSTYLNMMTWKLSPCCFLNSKYKHAYLNLRQTALTWCRRSPVLHSFFSIRMSIRKSQDHLFSVCLFPAQKPSVVLHDLYGENPILWPGLLRSTQHTVRDEQPGIAYRAWLLTSYAWADLQVVLIL